VVGLLDRAPGHRLDPPLTDRNDPFIGPALARGLLSSESVLHDGTAYPW
jgi:hypothetical protein